LERECFLNSPNNVEKNIFLIKMTEIIETKRLILRTLKVSDIKELLDFFERNRKFHEPWSPKFEDEFYTYEYQNRRIGYVRELNETDREYRFHIFKKDLPERVIGYATVSNIVRGVFQCGILGYAIDEMKNRKGYATEAINELINFSFKKIHLHRLEANVIPTNAASIRVLEKLNFMKEGCSKNYLKINGKWQDHLRFAIINPDYIDE
jgi:ribosomal-protein-alanine N-acetyltransferase